MDFGSLTFVNWIFFALMGRLLLFLFMKQPLSGWISKRWKFFDDLLSCTLCSGVWTYWILAGIFRLNFFSLYVPILSELFVGSITSYMVWMIETGWNANFRNIVIKE